MIHEPILSPRQQRERDYHREHAATRARLIDEPVPYDCLFDTKRRRWNAFWSMYDRILAANLSGKRVLIPGCGFGEDAIRLAKLGALVSAFDLSPESIEIAEARTAKAGLHVDYGVMPAETTTFADDTFDAIVFVDILHHVDIAATMHEVRRILKPGARVIGDELYTHTAFQKVRESKLVDKFAYGAMRDWIYGGDAPYITEDEHKIDEHEFAIVLDALAPDCELAWYNAALGRLIPADYDWFARLDRAAMRLAGPLGAKLAGRVVFSGTLSPR